MSGVFRSVLLTSVSWLLFACTDYQIAKPTTEGGRLCAAACDNSRAACDRIAETEASLEATGCDSGRQTTEQICSSEADTSGNAVEHCIAVPSAICVNPAPNYIPCTSDWELCVLSCGGRMTNSRTR